VVVGATGVSGMREIVVTSGPDQCGFHINPNDPADIAWGIVNAIQDPEKKFNLVVTAGKGFLNILLGSKPLRGLFKFIQNSWNLESHKIRPPERVLNWKRSHVEQ